MCGGRDESLGHWWRRLGGEMYGRSYGALEAVQDAKALVHDECSERNALSLFILSASHLLMIPGL